MFRYHVFALCKKPVGAEINRYLSELSPKQLRHRRRESFATLQKKLKSLTGKATIVEHPEQAAATVSSAHDISALLKKKGLRVICYGEPRMVSIGAQYLFHVRATFSTSPEKGESGSKILKESQVRIGQVLKTEFGAEAGPHPFTYIVHGDPNSRWLPDPKDRRNAGMAQLKNIEEALNKEKICAELGLRN